MSRTFTVAERRGLGFLRAAACCPELHVGDIRRNADSIVRQFERLAAQEVDLAVFPELCVTGYTCGDLFSHTALLDAAESAVAGVADALGEIHLTAVIGVPLRVSGRLYNCAAVLHRGRIAGVVPKQFLPNTHEYYEQRWFASGSGVPEESVLFAGHEVPFGTDLLFDLGGDRPVRIGVEICEDLWAVIPPSSHMALAGAQVLLNLSASTALLGKSAYRADLVRQQSARCLAAYVYSSSGPGESSTDVVFSGHQMIAENGILLGESSELAFSSHGAIADIDLQYLEHERRRNSSYSSASLEREWRIIELDRSVPEQSKALPLERTFPAHPFVPSDMQRRGDHCREIFAIQATGLAKRLRHLACDKVVIGVSGGLDSTLALLVAARAFDALELPQSGILAVTMPGLGTSERTRSNASRLAPALGASFSEINISDAVRAHFRDIGHDGTTHDIAFENAQARERTQVLMDLANARGAIVVGTGDLSETALGWCTYGGDHLSMYHVNVAVPKTLVRYLIEWCAAEEFSGEASEILHDICDTPISPELLPVKDGEIWQHTEATIGPYELHDFFLYHFVRRGAPTEKILALAAVAFDGRFEEEEIRRWLGVFVTRFFSQQFKRSAMPDGPKVGTVALSPRADWRMPSDMSGTIWSL